MYAVMRKLFFEIFHEFWSECFQISNKLWGNVSSVLKAERCMYKQISTAVFSGRFVALFFEFLENISSLPVEAHYLMMIYIYSTTTTRVQRVLCRKICKRIYMWGYNCSLTDGLEGNCYDNIWSWITNHYQYTRNIFQYLLKTLKCVSPI